MEKLGQDIPKLSTQKRNTPPVLNLATPPFKKATRFSELNNREQAVESQNSYAGAVVNGVAPLHAVAPPGGQQGQDTPRQSKNICFGTSKSSGPENTENLLAADVDLVARGVSKECTDANLMDFLKDKGINPILYTILYQYYTILYYTIYYTISIL